MPVRFTSPGLGGQRETFLRPHEWQIGIAYRRLFADKWYVGTDVREDKAPFGQPLFLDINSLDLALTYGITNRTSLTLTLPFSYGTHSRLYQDNVRHRVEALGLGDVSVTANLWLRDPKGQASGNVALGLGIKVPTGSNNVKDDFFNADGSISQRPVDQSIQLGDGGWGIMLQAYGFQRLVPRASAYFVGSYLLSPKETADVGSPIKNVLLSVPDVYSARAGLAYDLWPDGGVGANLGLRLDGIPLRDIIGGGDNGFRRPGYTLFLDPGVAIRRGKAEVTLNLPLRLHQDFRSSLIDRQLGGSGGGDLANYLIFVGFTRRF